MDEEYGMGLASFILGALSLSFFFLAFPCVLSLIGIILGIVQIKKHPRKGFAAAGIITGLLAIVLCVVGYAYMLGNDAFIQMLADDFLEVNL